MEEVKERFKNIYSIIKAECIGYKEITESVHDKFTSIYGYRFKGNVYYNDYNILLNNTDDASFLINVLPSESLLFQMNLREYDESFYIVRFIQDGPLSSILI